jgi:hypothetical protein
MMKRLLLIGFVACTFALAPTLPASAVPGVQRSAGHRPTRRG